SVHCVDTELYFFFLLILRPPLSTPFPYTTLFRSPLEYARAAAGGDHDAEVVRPGRAGEPLGGLGPRPAHRVASAGAGDAASGRGDRKSTRLNSSHVEISYAVFCLKKKKTRTHTT